MIEQMPRFGLKTQSIKSARSQWTPATGTISVCLNRLALQARLVIPLSLLAGMMPMINKQGNQTIAARYPI
jgi:hypothetical protein